MKDEGRVARKLRALLEAKGYTDVRLYPTTGFWRTDSRADCYRWTGSARLGTMTVSFQSWFTMTEIARGEFSIDDDGDVSPVAEREEELT